MKDNILIVIGFLSLAFLWSCSSPKSRTVTEQMDCATEQMNLDNLNKRLGEEKPYWQYEINLVDRDATKKWLDENCN